MLLSPSQVLEIVLTAKSRIITQIKEIQKEIADAKSLSVLNLTDKEVVNEEGLPIKDIKEDVTNDEERRGVSFEEEPPKKIYTMEEIDKMMDEAMSEEQAELEQLNRKHNLPEKNKEETINQRPKKAPIRAGDGLEVGTVSGEELLAKLMDDSKKRYDPINDTWMDNEDELTGEDEDWDDEEEEAGSEEEEDQYGRTRGSLVPPGLYKGATQVKGVKFASFDQPATPSTPQTEKPLKSSLKKLPSPTSDTAPLTTTRIDPAVSTDIVERNVRQDVPLPLIALTMDTRQLDTTGLRKISRFRAARQGI